MGRMGMELVKVGAFLYAMRYLAAAIFIGPGAKSWSAEHFDRSYGYVGSGLTVWAIVCVVAGVGLWIGALIEASSRKPSRSIEQAPVDGSRDPNW